MSAALVSTAALANGFDPSAFVRPAAVAVGGLAPKVSSATTTAARSDPPAAQLDGALQEVTHWPVQTASGLTLYLPASLRCADTYALLARECWPQPEASLLTHLLAGGVHALHLGAGHGVATLEMALASGTGQVLAWEHDDAARVALLRSVQVNRLADRVKLWPTGQGNAQATPAPFALDDWLQRHAPGLAVGVVKIEAAADASHHTLHLLAGARRFFASQSPVVVFACMQGEDLHRPLLDAWNGLGYALFRWSAELQMLLPFDAAHAETALLCTLVAVRPAQIQGLEARGLLVTAKALAEAAAEDAGASQAATPTSWDILDLVYRSGTLSPAQRVLHLMQCRDALLHASAQPEQDGDGLGIAQWVLLVHCLHALGQPHAAGALGTELLGQWPVGAEITGPVHPPLRQQAAQPQSTPSGPWLRQQLAEYLALHPMPGSVGRPVEGADFLELLQHPDHSAEVERHVLLAHVLGDRVMPAAQLAHLHHLGVAQPPCNAVLWRGIIESMRVIANAASKAAAPGVAGDGAARDRVARMSGSAAMVLAAMAQTQGLPPVAVVDVGASSLGQDTEPYAALLKAQLAQVTGFEPDAQALQVLRAQTAGETHRFLPHVVGNGAAAVFHATQWPLCSSLLEPNRPVLDRYHALGSLVQEKSRQAVQTVRLDDFIAAGGMDLLKIDVQGGEQMVFEGAPQRLDECLMVWTEVEFVPLYRGQPLFADIDQQLRRHGLQFLCLAGVAARSLASWPQDARAPQRAQMVWGDAIYVAGPERLARLDAAAAAKLALLAHHVAGAFDLCHAALQRLDAVAGTQWAGTYLAANR
jgi:protein O-GlcNAc transferase